MPQGGKTQASAAQALTIIATMTVSLVFTPR
jgi:hypothetical protein